MRHFVPQEGGLSNLFSQSSDPIRIRSARGIPILCLLFCAVLVANAQTISDFLVTTKGYDRSIALKESGTVTITWSNQGINFRDFDSQGGVQGDSVAVYSSSFASQGMLTYGLDNGMFAWRSVASSDHIMARMLMNNGVLGDSISYLEDVVVIDANRFLPQIVALTDTTYGVIWGGAGPGRSFPNYGIFAQIVTDSLQPVGTNVQLCEDSVSLGRGPAVASSPQAQRILVCWLDTASTNNHILYRLFDKNMIPVSQTRILADTGTAYHWIPSAAMNASGNSKVAWSGMSSDSVWRVYTLEIDSEGNAPEPPTVVADQNVIFASATSIAFDDSGKSVVGWEARTSSNTTILVQRFDNSGALVGTPFYLSTSMDTLNQYFPNMILRSNRIYAVWQAGSNPLVRARFIEFYDLTLDTDYVPAPVDGSFQLFQNFPNPFNSTTRISFLLPKDSRVTVEVVDILGRRIATLLNSTMSAGPHIVEWNATSANVSVASGMYFYRVSTPELSLTRTMILIR